MRQLVFHGERADGINLVTEEINAERQFAAKGIDIHDASTHRKLTGLVDIIHLVEAKVAQAMLQIGDVNGL